MADVRRFTAEQAQLFQQLVAGDSCFVTGEAGSGKSFVVREYFRELILSGRFTDGQLLYCGMTGAVANMMEDYGQTLHHAFCIPVVSPITMPEWIAGLAANSRALKNITDCQVLIIDEISFLKKSDFRLLFEVAAHFRPDSAHVPFTGMQVIAVGDYLQLSSHQRFELPFYDYLGVNHKEEPLPGISHPWKLLKPVVLKEIVRQSGDASLMKACRDLRFGNDSLTNETLDFLLELEVDKKWPGTISPVHLYPHTHSAAEENMRRLELLPGTTITYIARDSLVGGRLSGLTNLAQEFSARVGMPVLFLLNDTQRNLVNGSQGTIVDFQSRRSYTGDGCIGEFPDDNLYPVVSFSPDKKLLIGYSTYRDEPFLTAKRDVSSRKQLALLAAWALTIHKAQGMSIEYLVVDVSRLKQLGQFYTAISRAKSSTWLQIRGLSMNIKYIYCTRKKKQRRIISGLCHCFDAARYYRYLCPDPRDTNYSLKFEEKRNRFVPFSPYHRL